MQRLVQVCRCEKGCRVWTSPSTSLVELHNFLSLFNRAQTHKCLWERLSDLYPQLYHSSQLTPSCDCRLFSPPPAWNTFAFRCGETTLRTNQFCFRACRTTAFCHSSLAWMNVLLTNFHLWCCGFLPLPSRFVYLRLTLEKSLFLLNRPCPRSVLLCPTSLDATTVRSNTSERRGYVSKPT